jgi:hypothetical protein
MDARLRGHDEILAKQVTATSSNISPQSPKERHSRAGGNPLFSDSESTIFITIYRVFPHPHRLIASPVRIR